MPGHCREESEVREGEKERVGRLVTGLSLPRTRRSHGLFRFFRNRNTSCFVFVICACACVMQFQHVPEFWPSRSRRNTMAPIKGSRRNPVSRHSFLLPLLPVLFNLCPSVLHLSSLLSSPSLWLMTLLFLSCLSNVLNSFHAVLLRPLFISLSLFLSHSYCDLYAFLLLTASVQSSVLFSVLSFSGCLGPAKSDFFYVCYH